MVEERISRGDDGELEVLHAELALGPGIVALRLDTQSEDEGFQVLTIVAEELRIHRNGDVQVTLDDFIRLGEAYWTAFANRRLGSAEIEPA